MNYYKLDSPSWVTVKSKKFFGVPEPCHKENTFDHKLEFEKFRVVVRVYDTTETSHTI